MKILNEYLRLEGIEEMRHFFINRGIRKAYRKGEYLFHQNEKCQIVGYIQKGHVRYKRYTSKGDEQVVGYSFENDFVADYASFQAQSNTVISAQAIVDSEIFIISYKNFSSFFQTCKDKDFRRKLAEIWFNDIYNRMLSLYCDTPQERYLHLITRYPPILNYVTLKEIASFIKVTPETLSRIRKNIP